MNKTITITDLESVLAQYENDIYDHVKNNDDIDKLKEKYLDILKKEYELQDRSQSLNKSQDYFFQLYLTDLFEKKKNLYEKRIIRIKEDIPDILHNLKLCSHIV